MIAVVGPTGSEKSSLGLALSRHFGGEIVSCDSVQVYRQLDIGSAKMPEAEREGIQHHLLDVVAFTSELTAGWYARLARAAIRDIHARRKLPIVVGGTGLYLRALFKGLSPAPGRDAGLRARLEASEGRHSGVLHRLLRRVDSISASRIHPNDVPKLIRAIEISSLAQQPASLALDAPREGFAEVRLLQIGLRPDRQELRERLNTRVEQMFQAGLVEETRNLLSSLPSAAIPRSLHSLGYRQVVDFLQGRCALPEAIEQTQIKTRQYAKRQLTWFRADPAIRWIPDFGSAQIAVERASEWAQAFLLQ